MKKNLNFDGLSGQENFKQHSPVPCSKIGHLCEAFPYLSGQNISTPLLSANKNSSADLLKLGVAGKFWAQSFMLFPGHLVRSQTLTL